MALRAFHVRSAAITVLALYVFVSAGYPQQPVGVTSSDEDLKADLSLVPCKNKDRLEAVKKLFQKMGAVDAEISLEKFSDGQNLIVKKKGKTDEITLVGAHYDKIGDGCGAIDNWTGIVIIANLYRTLRNVETEKTYYFVAFDKEELGLEGSAAMVKSIPKDNRAGYCSMVNIDSFGFDYPQVLENASTPKMTALAKSLAAELKMPFASASIPNADADSSSFKNKDIPAITFHGLNSKWQQYLHSSNDKLANIKLSSVGVGYRFILQFLARVDSGGCGIFRNK